jgi:hypothetical protein
MDSAMITSGQVDEAVRLTLGRNPHHKNLQQVENTNNLLTED